MLGNKGRKQNYREGGTRGGQDQFKWEDVKNDRDRENYLGNSLHAPTGEREREGCGSCVCIYFVYCSFVVTCILMFPSSYSFSLSSFQP